MLGALKPLVFLAGSAHTMSFVGWECSKHEFSRQRALKPRIFAAGIAQTEHFLSWERLGHEFGLPRQLFGR